MTSFETNARTGLEVDSRIARPDAGNRYVVSGNHHIRPAVEAAAVGGRSNSESSSASRAKVRGDEEEGKGGRTTPTDKLALELVGFNALAEKLQAAFKPEVGFGARCEQAFELANELFVNSPTWVCFYRSLMGSRGFILALFPDDEEFGAFLRTEQYHQIQLMLTALRSRDLPENDPNDPQRMITVRLPKSLHEAMCEEANRLNISVNRLCISRMLQLLDPAMIPETPSKPRGRKPRLRNRGERS